MHLLPDNSILPIATSILSSLTLQSRMLWAHGASHQSRFVNPSLDLLRKVPVFAAPNSVRPLRTAQVVRAMTVRELIQPEAETAKLQVSGEVQRDQRLVCHELSETSASSMTQASYHPFGRWRLHTTCNGAP